MKTQTLIVFLMCCAPFLGEAQHNFPPIIDMHQHARFSLDLQEDGTPWPRMCFPQPCERQAALAQKDEDILRITLEMMDRYNIVKAVVSDENLEEVKRWQASAPETFLAGGATFHPSLTDTATLRQAFEAGELQVMGEIGAQYAGIAPDDPVLEPYFAIAEAYDVPVLIHCGGLGGGDHNFKLSQGNPLALEEVLNRHPGLRLYIENAGWPFLAETAALMYRFPNVYADLSTITWIIPEQAFYDYVKELMSLGLGKRLMYGSDQMMWPEAISVGIERILAADFLAESEKRDMLYHNAARFLRLSEKEITNHMRNK